MIKEYKHYNKNQIYNMELPMIDGRLRVVPVCRIVGFCHCMKHKGYLDIDTLKKHECISKDCNCIQKFEDYPFWVQRANKKKERVNGKKRKKKQNQMKRLFDNRLTKIKQMSQKEAGRLKFPMIITSVSLRKPNRYILNYVSNEGRDDSEDFALLAEELNKKEIGKFFLNHITDFDGYYATIRDYKTLRK